MQVVHLRSLLRDLLGGLLDPPCRTQPAAFLGPGGVPLGAARSKVRLRALENQAARRAKSPGRGNGLLGQAHGFGEGHILDVHNLEILDPPALVRRGVPWFFESNGEVRP